ncbi:VENN motif pre-toxin domain-containing protein, partial [Yersinia rohdei]|uniref:VENN motif pre-toxin domain-containing protein n=1 Tax=Yersinia rohdei TaxID=29485 RepID=UPI001643BF83
GISTGGNIGGQFAGNMANGLLVGANNEGHADGITHAAVSDGTITIRDSEKQQQNVDDLSRDVEHANNALSPIFNKEKEQNRLREAQLIGEIGSQVADIVRTQGDINGLKAAQEKLGPLKENTTEKERAAYMTELRDSDAYKKVMKEYGTGSTLQQGIQAATAAIQGLAGGDMAKALAGASAPYLAEVIHNMTTDANGKVNTEANLMAHAVLGAVMAQINGNSALAGASGAMMGEYIAQQMYPGVKREDLTEEQRQTISALGTLAAGLAGGLAGGSTADAVAGAQAGKNAVENNNLSKKGCGLDPLACRNPLIEGGGIRGGVGKSIVTNKTQMLGQNGVQTSSKTIWKGTGKERIDVENPNPGQRSGQLHYQDNQGNKYLYDPKTNSFLDAPKSVNNLLYDTGFKKAIEKGLY